MGGTYDGQTCRQKANTKVETLYGSGDIVLPYKWEDWAGHVVMMDGGGSLKKILNEEFISRIIERSKLT